jgi:hypothetical protein
MVKHNRGQNVTRKHRELFHGQRVHEKYKEDMGLAKVMCSPWASAV